MGNAFVLQGLIMAINDDSHSPKVFAPLHLSLKSKILYVISQHYIVKSQHMVYYLRDILSHFRKKTMNVRYQLFDITIFLSHFTFISRNPPITILNSFPLPTVTRHLSIIQLPDPFMITLQSVSPTSVTPKLSKHSSVFTLNSSAPIRLIFISVPSVQIWTSSLRNDQSLYIHGDVDGNSTAS